MVAQSGAGVVANRYAAMLYNKRLPAAFVDLDVVDANLQRVIEYANGVPVRLATKSIRLPAVIDRVLDRHGAGGSQTAAPRPDVIGLMCASAEEAVWWANHRPGTDILIAYPSVEREDLVGCLAAVSRGETIRFMVDCRDHIDLLQDLAATAGVTAELCIDLDMSVDVPRIGLRFGVHRSPLRDVDAVLGLARYSAQFNNVKLVGLMGYEAQIAGLQDRSAPSAGVGGIFNPRGVAIRQLKATTVDAAMSRRREAVRALEQAGFELSLVNGGGSGSVPSTAAEPDVSEIAVGSALFCPTSFDGYDAVQYEAAAGFGLRVTRRPEPHVVTCFGGGWTASGASGADRLPTVWWPDGAQLMPNEGAGEVQTPVLLSKRGGVELGVGDVVIFRHTKAGELCNRVEHVWLFAVGEEPIQASTYRGEGLVLS